MYAGRGAGVSNSFGEPALHATKRLRRESLRRQRDLVYEGSIRQSDRGRAPILHPRRVIWRTHIWEFSCSCSAPLRSFPASGAAGLLPFSATYKTGQQHLGHG